VAAAARALTHHLGDGCNKTVGLTGIRALVNGILLAATRRATSGSSLRGHPPISIEMVRPGFRG